MKKTYINPKMVVITLIQQQHLMAGSESINFGGNTTSVTGMDSRGGSDWDDDEY